MKTIKTSNTKKDVLLDDIVFEILKNELLCDTGTRITINPKDEITRNQVHISITRLILFTDAPTIDHKDRNYYNCQIENLRPANFQQNLCNKGKQKSYYGMKCKSKFKGVTWDKEKHKWLASIWKANKRYHIGRFEKEIDAAKAYNEWAKKLHGEFAYINPV